MVIGDDDPYQKVLKRVFFLVLKLRVSISSKVDHDSLVSSKMEKP